MIVVPSLKVAQEGFSRLRVQPSRGAFPVDVDAENRDFADIVARAPMTATVGQRGQSMLGRVAPGSGVFERSVVVLIGWGESARFAGQFKGTPDVANSLLAETL